MHDEIMWRLKYFWTVLNMYFQKDPVHKRLKNVPGYDRTLSWNLETYDGKQEYHEGTFCQFVKWLIFHKKVF